MRKLDRGGNFWFKGIFRLCLCLVVVGIIILGAAERTDAASAAGSAPDIKVFSADPLVLPDGGSALYSFAVQGAMNIQLVEAGEVIKEINGLAANRYKGTVRGRTTYQIRKGSGNTFEAMLVASNAGGIQKKALTLTYATKFQPKPASLIPPVSDNGTDHRTKWGPPASAPSRQSATPTASNWPPQFFKCPSGCGLCLRPEDAASHGLTQKCSEQPCYYPPDKSQYWYCYGEPKGWCCKDGKVTPATEAQCKEAGGSWYATEAEANKACQLPVVWCCASGKVYQTTKDQCAQAGGSGYATEAEATRACGLPGWCCRNGQLTQATQTQCVQSLTAAGGVWYATQAEAAKACEQPCWCCTSGRYGQTTTDACGKMGGTCYATQAQASERCQPLGGCCANGNVSQSTQTQCAQVGGKWYSSVTEAQRACVPPTTYWCCSNGQVYQSKTLGRGCYATQAEATRACQPVTRPPILK